MTGSIHRATTLKSNQAIIVLTVVLGLYHVTAFAGEIYKPSQHGNANKIGTFLAQSRFVPGESWYQQMRMVSPAYAQTIQSAGEKKKFPDYIDLGLIMGIAIMSIAGQKPLALMLFVALLVKALL